MLHYFNQDEIDQYYLNLLPGVCNRKYFPLIVQSQRRIKDFEYNSAYEVLYRNDC